MAAIVRILLRYPLVCPALVLLLSFGSHCGYTQCFLERGTIHSKHIRRNVISCPTQSFLLWKPALQNSCALHTLADRKALFFRRSFSLWAFFPWFLSVAQDSQQTCLCLLCRCWKGKKGTASLFVKYMLGIFEFLVGIQSQFLKNYTRPQTQHCFSASLYFPKDEFSSNQPGKPNSEWLTKITSKKKCYKCNKQKHYCK